MTRLDHLRELTRNLKALLDDPHEGLMTWNDAVGRTLTELAAYAPLPAAPPLSAFVVHKVGCSALCSVCERPEVSIYHRKHWKPGCGVFWHDFKPHGTCTCGLIAAQTAHNTRTDADVEDDLRGIHEGAGEA